MPIITIEECDQCEEGECIECIKACPRNILKMNNGKVEVVNLIDCSMCRLCEEVCDMNAIKVGEDLESFVMTVETSGSIAAAELEIEAACSIKKRAEQLVEILETL